MNAYGTALFVIGCIPLGCAFSQPKQQSMEDLWVEMTEGKIAFYPGGPTVSLLDPNRTTEPSMARACVLRRFEKSENYGRFTAVTAYSQALLLDGNKQPIWAGNWIVALRVQGRVTGLLLLKELLGDPSEVALYQIGWLSLDPVRPVFYPTEITHAYVNGGALYRGGGDWITDIDGDGTDEVVTVEPEDLLGAANPGWRLYVYRWGMPAHIWGMTSQSALFGPREPSAWETPGIQRAVHMILPGGPSEVRVRRGTGTLKCLEVFRDVDGVSVSLARILCDKVGEEWIVQTGQGKPK
jgi:hypothetical protein